MDRLQVAIERAREQRSEVLKSGSDTTGPLLKEDAKADVVDVPKASQDGIWESLQPIDLKARPLRSNRLMSAKGGPSAAPYDVLRTRMLHHVRQNGWKTVGIVSPTPECGKTTATANLAFSFSRQPEVRTVVIDLDLRRPALGKTMGQTTTHSMQDVLMGDVPFQDHALRLGNNVAIGFNKSPAKNPSELLQSSLADRNIEQISEDFDPDLLLIDLPPMLSTDDNFGFLSKIDAVLLIVAAEETTMSQVEVTLTQLNDLTNVLGITLNKCRHGSGAYGYGYGKKYQYG